MQQKQSSKRKSKMEEQQVFEVYEKALNNSKEEILKEFAIHMIERQIERYQYLIIQWQHRLNKIRGEQNARIKN